LAALQAPKPLLILKGLDEPQARAACLKEYDSFHKADPERCAQRYREAASKTKALLLKYPEFQEMIEVEAKKVG
jgi:hypothetical protein